ncbi:hypothetical protein, partial [Sphingopyxis sp. KK2]|uniref:hypothetical protein n=1 Tax=Sphingopyxis sp. KK2 TaxID=1855727 RepID=UPI001C4DE981
GGARQFAHGADAHDVADLQPDLAISRHVRLLSSGPSEKRRACSKGLNGREIGGLSAGKQKTKEKARRRRKTDSHRAKGKARDLDQERF